MRQSEPGDEVTRSGRPSPAQRWSWFFDQLHPDNPVTRSVLALRVAGRVDVSALEQSLRGACDRHDALRSVFECVDGLPVRRAGSRTVDWLTADMAGDANDGAAVWAAAAPIVGRPFDLAAGPLLLGIFLAAGADQGVFLLVAHSSVADRTSLAVVARETFAVYDGLVGARRDPARVLRVDGALPAADAEPEPRALEYWKRQLADVPLELPSDAPRPRSMTFEASVASMPLSPDLSRALAGMADEQATHDLGTFVAALAAVIHRYTGAQDVAVGLTTSGRRGVPSDAVGPYENLVVVRTAIPKGASFGICSPGCGRRWTRSGRTGRCHSVRSWRSWCRPRTSTACPSVRSCARRPTSRRTIAGV